MSALIFCAALFGCGASVPIGSMPQGNGNSSVVLAMTDTPPSNVSILSAEVTLTGATLMPGNVSLLSASTTVELTRLQTDIAYLATATNIPSGTFTSVVLTFANPSLTIENDTTSAIGGCAVAAICTIPPTTVANLSTTVPLTSFSVANSSTTGLLIDVSLDSLLSATVGADFSAGTTVTAFTPAGTAAPPVGAEDVVGHVSNVNTTSNTFTLTNATASYALKFDSASTLLQFPVTSSCPSAVFACLQNNQILSVDIGIQGDGSILARNVIFEDTASSDAEVEGMIISTNLGSQQFSIVALAVSGTGTGLTIGEPVTVQYSVSPATTFDVDFVHADSSAISTTGFVFNAPVDLVAGQQVSIRRNSTSSGATIKADRVRLRSSRLTATVQSIGSGIINLSNLPSLFFGHGGITQVQAQTFVPTILFEIGHTFSVTNIGISNVLSVRGPLFNASGGRTVLVTKVVLKP